jgi:excisionase family DNA binding protein
MPVTIRVTDVRWGARSRSEIDMTEPWLSAAKIATQLGFTKDAVYVWVADKGMPAHRAGRLWSFQASEIDEWVRSGGTAQRPTAALPKGGHT